MTPSFALNARFRNRVRDLLVPLGQAPGLGLKIVGCEENCILLYPRLGNQLSCLREILSLKWYTYEEATDQFILTDSTEIEKFLNSLVAKSG